MKQLVKTLRALRPGEKPAPGGRNKRDDGGRPWWIHAAGRAGAALLRLTPILALLAGCGLGPVQNPLLKLEQAHPFGAMRVSFDATGERLASAGFDGDIAVWTVPGGEPLFRAHGHDRPVRGLAWADGYLASGGEDGVVSLWSLEDARPVAVQGGLQPVTSMAWQASAAKLVTGHRDGSVRTWSVPSLQPVDALDLGARILSIASHPHEGLLAVSTAARHVWLLGPKLELRRELVRPARNALELRFSPDGGTLAAGAWYQTLFWDLKTGTLRTGAGHYGAVISIDYSPDGRQLASIGRWTDAGIRVTRVDDGVVSRQLAGHELCGYAVRISPDGRTLASGSEDGSVRFYDLSAPYKPEWTVR